MSALVWLFQNILGFFLCLVDTYLGISPVLSLDATSKNSASSKEATLSVNEKLDSVSKNSSELSLRTSKDKPISLRDLCVSVKGRHRMFRHVTYSQGDHIIYCQTGTLLKVKGDVKIVL